MGGLRILHLEDNPDDNELIRITLSLAGIDADIRLVASRQDFAEALRDFAPDIILADYNLPGFSGLEGLEIRNEQAPDIPLIFVTGSLGDDLAVTTLRLGATDFVLKDRMARLPDAIQRARQESEQRIERRRLDAELAAEREVMRATLDSAQAAIVVLDGLGTIVSANPRAASMVGATPASLPGWAFWEVFPSPANTGSAREQVRLALEWPHLPARDSWTMTTVGGRVVTWTSGAITSPGRAERVVLSGIDITEQRQAEHRVHYLGHFDQTTGLPNRQHFLQNLEERCGKRNVGTPSVLAVMLIALQRLEEIADSDGEEAIDRICQAMTERLKESQKQEPLLARVSENGFALATELVRGCDLDDFAQHIIDILSAPVAVGGRQQVVPVRSGVALLPDDAADPRQLMRAAEAALHYAETSTERSYSFYTPLLSDQARERLQLESELRAALVAENQLALHYQPQVNLDTGRIEGLEALIRWQHPQLGWLPPGRFIPLAEVCGLMNELGAWVLQEACRQLVQWDQAGIAAPTVAINLSASQFTSPSLFADIDQTLARFGIVPERLELELTESTSMRDPQASVAIMAQFRERGLKIAIDDFGTGYSNLSYLKRFPVNRLKLDQAFVRDIVSDADDQAISRAIIAMAHQLRLEVIAEGVETAAQRDFLKAAGCDIAQGFLLSRPIPAAECALLLGQPVPLV